MPTKYLDEEGLSHVVRRAKETFAEKKELWNWQKTEKAEAVAFEPVPDSVLEPVVEFKFKETLPAEGEKGPDNPSTIEGVSSIFLVHGNKNYVTLPYHTPTRTWYGVDWTINADNSVTAVGTATETSSFYFTGHNTNDLRLVPGRKYYLRGCPSGGSSTTYHLRVNSGIDATYAIAVDYGEGAIFEPKTSDIVIVAGVVSNGQTVDGITFKPQLEDGETGTVYDLARREEINIPLGNTYYGGDLDIASGVITITQAIITVDQNTSFSVNTFGESPDTYRIGFFPTGINELGPQYVTQDNIACNRLLATTEWPTETGVYINNGNTSIRFFLSKTDFNLSNNQTFETISSTFKSWLEEHPLIVTYPIKEPYTVQLDPIQIKSLASLDKYEPRINTIYTDADSVQVGYQRFVDDENIVHKSNDETITGVKTFKNTASGHSAGETVTDLIVRNEAVQRGVGGEGRSYTRVIFADADGDIEETYAGRLGFCECVTPKENDTLGSHIQMGAYKYSQETTDLPKHADLRVGWDADGVQFATGPETSDKRNNPADVVTRGWAESKTWNWQKTEKASAIAFKPVPESDLEPIVDFMFTETPLAEGTKGPDNPSTIMGVSNVGIGRCGKNILPSEPAATTMAERGITVTKNSDGSYHLSGTANINAIPYMYFFAATPGILPDALPLGETITISCKCSDSYVFTRFFEAYESDLPDSFGTFYTVGGGTSVSKTITINPDVKGLMYAILVNPGSTVDCDVYCQIEYGTKATEWEAPADDTYTLALGDTYYGGSIDLKTGLMTVTHCGIVYDGTENWDGPDDHSQNGVACYSFARSIPSNLWALSTNAGQNATNTICSHFDWVNNTNLATNHFYIPGSGGYPAYFTTFCTTRDDWKTWLQNQYAAGHPLTLAYKLATPFTVQLTTTQICSLPALDKYNPRINTVYSDQEAVQVGYQRYANYVDLKTDQTIEGIKTFKNAYDDSPNSSNPDCSHSIILRTTRFRKGTDITTLSGHDYTGLIFQDNTGSLIGHDGRLGMVGYGAYTHGTYVTKILTHKNDLSEPNDMAEMGVGYDPQGRKYAYAEPTSTERTGSTDIITRGYFNNTLSNYLPLTGGVLTGKLTVDKTSNSPSDSSILVKSSAQNYAFVSSDTSITKGTAPSTMRYQSVSFYGKDINSYNQRLGCLEHTLSTSNTSSLSIFACNTTSNTNDNRCTISVNVDGSGKPYTSAPSPGFTEDSTQIATARWVRRHNRICCGFGENPTQPFCLIASSGVRVTDNYCDWGITLLVDRPYAYGMSGSGICTITLRTSNASNNEPAACQLKWLARTNDIGDCIKVGLINTPGNAAIDIYFYNTVSWLGGFITVLSQSGNRYNNPNAYYPAGQGFQTFCAETGTPIKRYTTMNEGAQDLWGEDYTDTIESAPYISDKGGNIQGNVNFVAPNVVRGVVPSARSEYDIFHYDKNNAKLGAIAFYYETTKASRVGLFAYDTTITANNVSIGQLSIGCDSSGNIFTQAPTPAATDNSTQIATTAWVRSRTYDSIIRLQNPNITKGSNPTSTQYLAVYACDKNGTSYSGNTLGIWETNVKADGTVSSYVRALKNTANTDISCTIGAGYYTSSSTPFVFCTGSIQPNSGLTCGTSNYKWSSIWATNGTIQTSDERVKTAIDSIPDAILDAWNDVQWKQFKMKECVEQKGDGARLHTGIIAQQIQSVFNDKNINPADYGFFCWDKWEDSEEILDQDGNVVKEGVKAGEQYSIRYEEALCIEAAYQRRKNNILEKRISELETQVQNMLQIIESLKGA